MNLRARRKLSLHSFSTLLLMLCEYYWLPVAWHHSKFAFFLHGWKKSCGVLTKTFFASRNCKVAMQRVDSSEHLLLTRRSTAISSRSKCNKGLEPLPFGSRMESPWQLFYWGQHGYTGKYWNLENSFGMEISFGNQLLFEMIDSLW